MERCRFLNVVYHTCIADDFFFILHTRCQFLAAWSICRNTGAMSMEDDIALANRLADAARDAIRPYYRSGVATERKADASPVTLADRAAEEAMRRILTAEAARDPGI